MYGSDADAENIMTNAAKYNSGKKFGFAKSN